MEPRLRASPEQFSILVEFMERHGDIARPQVGAQGRLKVDRLWIMLATAINSVCGGVRKPLDRWKKVWADFKAKTKKKAFSTKKHTNGTSTGPRLTTLEERVLGIMGLLNADGQVGVEEQGINIPNSSPSQFSELQEPSMFLDIEIGGVPATTSTNHNVPPRLQSSTIRCSRAHPNEIAPRCLVRSVRRQLLKRRRTQAPTNRTPSGFMAVELRRLRLEGIREQNFHQRETERLRLESLRIEVDRENARALHRLADIAQSFLEKMH